jgi:hypothetical protein
LAFYEGVAEKWPLPCMFLGCFSGVGVRELGRWVVGARAAPRGRPAAAVPRRSPAPLPASMSRFVPIANVPEPRSITGDALR